jgi:hypothetical protein
VPNHLVDRRIAASHGEDPVGVGEDARPCVLPIYEALGEDQVVAPDNGSELAAAPGG